MKTYQGTCHCGHLKFSVDLDLEKGGTRCNCTICTKTASTNATVKPAQFTALTDESTLGHYAWGTKMATRYFCPHCGVHAYGRGHLEQMGGDFVSVNLNCLDGVDHGTLALGYWDGRHNNWQAGTRPQPWPV
jgi:hypothetical protein